MAQEHLGRLCVFSLCCFACFQYSLLFLVSTVAKISFVFLLPAECVDGRGEYIYMPWRVRGGMTCYYLLVAGATWSVRRNGNDGVCLLKALMLCARCVFVCSLVAGD